jgi:hypothetical protein
MNATIKCRGNDGKSLKIDSASSSRGFRRSYGDELDWDLNNKNDFAELGCSVFVCHPSITFVETGFGFSLK